MATAKKTQTYAAAGVDIDKGDALVDYLKGVNPAIGGFAGLFKMPKGMKDPRLVASTDGVGTKLLVAQLAGRHETIGIDLVAMVVNDLIVCGASPLFFLDYFATGKLKEGEAKAILKGIIEGCAQAGCPLIGGETAEMPGMYAPGHYDLAGFGVGVVRSRARARRPQGQTGQCDSRIVLKWRTLQRLFAGAAGAAARRSGRGEEGAASETRQGRPDAGRGAAGADENLREERAGPAGTLPDRIGGAYHRRRASPATWSACCPRGLRRSSTWPRGRRRRSSAPSPSAARSRKRRCSRCSTWALALS